MFWFVMDQGAETLKLEEEFNKKINQRLMKIHTGVKESKRKDASH